MNDTILKIASTLTPGSPCATPALPHAKAIYAAHVKPLDEALAKAEADKATLMEALEAAADYIGDESCGSSEFWDKYRVALATYQGTTMKITTCAIRTPNGCIVSMPRQPGTITS